MAGTTRKQLVNKVLRLLREDQLTTNQSIEDVPYAETIGDFINDVKEEVEDAWNWTQLRQFLSLTTEAGSDEYNLGDADFSTTSLTAIDSDQNTIILTGLAGYDTQDASNERTQILEMYNSTEDVYMKRVSDKYINRQNKLTNNPQRAAPIYYSIRGFDAEGDMVVKFYPIPDGEYTIETWCYLPQEPLETDTSVLVLSCAETAIVYGSWAMAVSERGEDGGQLYDEVYRKYREYLNAAIGRDRELKFSLDEGHEGDFQVW